MELTNSFIDSKFAQALDIFKTIRPEEKGSQLVVKVKGKTVIDLSARVNPDSLTTVFSVSKALSALGIAKLVGSGKLDVDQTVAHYWPEFAANGKESITVRQLLSHQAGLVEPDPQITTEQIHHDLSLIHISEPTRH